MAVDLTVLPRTGGVSEDAVIKQLHAEASSLPSESPPPLYEDDGFPPEELTTLYVDPKKRPEYAAASVNGQVAWYRPTEYTDDPDYFKATAGCGVLREGVLSDAWLLGVFAALALHPDNLIENLFVSDSLHGFKQYGVYTCRFYKNCQWVTVTTDTRVPYSIELEDDEAKASATTPGHLLYGGSLQKNEVFVPLLEKAYAKLHGSYQSLALDGQGGGNVSGRILEALLDCTGGSALRVDIADEKRKWMAASATADTTTSGSGSTTTSEDLTSPLGSLWKRLVKYMKRKCVVTTQMKQLSFNAFDLTPLGILKNRQYVVLHVKEVAVNATAPGQPPPPASSSSGQQPASSSSTTVLRFVKLKNVWGRGMWKGEWSNDDSKWEEYLQVELALRNDPACAFNRSGSDGCFWMVWEDFVESFNELYVAHVFGSNNNNSNEHQEDHHQAHQQYHQYCVAGEWLGYAAGGAPASQSRAGTGTGTRPATTTAATGDPHHHQSVLAKERPINRTKWAVLTDADANWHRNPQYKLSVPHKTCGVVVSLLQRDFRIFGGDNYAVNVVIIQQKQGKTSIVWEFSPRHVAAEAHSYETNSFLPRIHPYDHHSSSSSHGTISPPSTAGAAGTSGGSSSATGAGAGTVGKQIPEREIVKEDLVLEPDACYFVVPYTDHGKVEMEFFLRVFAPKQVCVERIAPVFTCVQQGKWRNDDSMAMGGGGGGAGSDANGSSSVGGDGGGMAATSTTAGGPLCVQLHGGDENAAWCQNPQFWLRLKPMDAKKQAKLLATKSFATLKLIVRKTSLGNGSGSTGGTGGGGGMITKARLKELSKEKFNLVGLTVVRAKDAHGSGQEDDSSSSSDKKPTSGAGGGGASAKGSGAGSNASVLRAQAKAPKTNFLGEIIEKPQWKTSASSDRSRHAESKASHHQDQDANDLEDDDERKDSSSVQPPLSFPTPRLVVNPEEWCRVSDYSSPLVACMYLRKLPKEWLLHENGGLMVVPSLGEAGAEASFDLQVDCDFPVLLDELPRFTTQSVPGEWHEDSGTSVGCHLHQEWKKNPKFYLFLKGVRPAKVKITLTRSELEWKGKCKRDPVGTMMGFYLFHGQRLTRASEASGGGPNQNYHAIIVNGRPWSETDFVPLHSVASPPELMLPSAFNEPYVIMPATYEPGKTGKFVLSVQCDTEFTLTNEEP